MEQRNPTRVLVVTVIWSIIGTLSIFRLGHDLLFGRPINWFFLFFVLVAATTISAVFFSGQFRHTLILIMIGAALIGLVGTLIGDALNIDWLKDGGVAILLICSLSFGLLSIGDPEVFAKIAKLFHRNN